jgi:hypothetical protein
MVPLLRDRISDDLGTVVTARSLTNSQVLGVFVNATFALHSVVPDHLQFPLRQCIRHGAQRGHTWPDDRERAVRPTRWPVGLAKSPKLVAGWREQRKTPTPKAFVT